tara:strand:- start:389 stop:532 length:144 start_codon:yes stop_codon:yes gene_type:complete
MTGTGQSELVWHDFFESSVVAKQEDAPMFEVLPVAHRLQDAAPIKSV